MISSVKICRNKFSCFFLINYWSWITIFISIKILNKPIIYLNKSRMVCLATWGNNLLCFSGHVTNSVRKAYRFSILNDCQMATYYQLLSFWGFDVRIPTGLLNNYILAIRKRNHIFKGLPLHRIPCYYYIPVWY